MHFSIFPRLVGAKDGDRYIFIYICPVLPQDKGKFYPAGISSSNNGNSISGFDRQ